MDIIYRVFEFTKRLVYSHVCILAGFFCLTFTFNHSDTENSYALRVVSYDPDKLNYFKDFIFFFPAKYFTEFINITYPQF